MKRFAIIAILLFSANCILAQGYNSREGSHRGYYSPDSRPQTSVWSGSGIALGKRIFATNNHVVDGSTHLYAYFPETQQRYFAKVLCVDATNDLAIVEISDTLFTGFPTIEYGFKRSIEEIGEDVFVLGYPLVSTMGEEVKLTTGVISARSGYQGDKSQYQISAPVQPGNSGGPLFNSNGELIGIVSAKHTEADNVSYGVKLGYLLDLAIRQSIKIDTTLKNSLMGKRLSEQCRTIIPCTVLVIADNEFTPSSYDIARTGKESPTRPSQSVQYPFHVNMPTVARRSSDAVELYGIEMDISGTVFYLTYTNGSNKTISFNVSKNIYLVDKLTGKRYHLLDAKGCAIFPKRVEIQPGSSLDFELYFPQLPKETIQLDLCSPNAEDSFWIYGIEIK